MSNADRVEQAGDRLFVRRVFPQDGRSMVEVWDPLSGTGGMVCPVLCLGGGSSSLHVPLNFPVNDQGEVIGDIEAVVLYTAAGNPVFLGTLEPIGTLSGNVTEAPESPDRDTELSNAVAYLRTLKASLLIDPDGVLTLRAAALRVMAPRVFVSPDGEPGDTAVGAERLGVVLLEMAEEMAAQREMLETLAGAFVLVEEAKIPTQTEDKPGLLTAYEFLATGGAPDVSSGRYSIDDFQVP